jgi:hypothetical protein
MKVLTLKIPVHDIYAIIDGVEIPDDLFTSFFVPLRRFLSQHVNQNAIQYPHIDFDEIREHIEQILEDLSPEQEKALRKLGYGSGTIAKTTWDSTKEHKALMVFLSRYPHYSNLFQNVHLLADIVMFSTEVHFNGPITTANFIQAKKFIDDINRRRWSRAQTNNEQQSGVSNLGAVSETLLAKALGNLIDGVNFFKTNNPGIQSYGDFVLMCLPNNLWLSVKSNFARERLLASGYTTDILGVGFFTSMDEFISPSKIRNLQRVGFLGMYLPDIPISERQVEENKSTYHQVLEHYGEIDDLPKNINGTVFLRPLSQLHSDLSLLLSQENIANRTTLQY